jgi:hypothetical protein
MRRRRAASGVQRTEQIDQVAVVGHDRGIDLRMRPVAAPDEPFRIGARQRVVQRPRIAEFAGHESPITASYRSLRHHCQREYVAREFELLNSRFCLTLQP